MPNLPKFFQRRGALRAVIGCALGLAVIAASPARAEDGEPPEDKIMDGIMGALGLSRGGGPSIEYRERSPLVVPREATLPPPAAATVKDPNWPVNPEIKEAKALAASRKNDGRTSSQRMDDGMLPLSPSELNKGRTYAKQNNPRSSSDNMHQTSSWSELGYKGGLFGGMFSSDDNDAAKFTGEPPRTSLIAPPVGYQTPSPNQPYSTSKDKWTPKAIDSYTERGMNIGK